MPCRFLTFNLCFLFVLQLYAQSYTQAKDPTLKAFLDEELEELFTSVKTVGASIAFVDHGKVVYSGGFGYANQANERLADTATIYRAASMTKTVTAIAIMQLVEADMIRLDAPINTYLPELILYDRGGSEYSPLIQDVLTHLSGLPSDFLNGMTAVAPLANDWLINNLNGTQLSTSANYTQAYSNVGYGLLGNVIESVSGMSYEQYLEKRIFKPLGMTSASLGLVSDDLAKGYVDGKEVARAISKSAASGIHASVLDMAELLKLFLGEHPNGNQVLSRESIELMQHNRLSDCFLPTAYGYGYGLDVRKGNYTDADGPHQMSFYKHSGSEIAFHGEFGYLPELGVGVITMVNTDRGLLACDSKDLIDLYLQYRSKTSSTTFDYSYRETGLEEPAEEEVVGWYNIGPTAIEVNDPNRISFRFEGSKVVLKRRPNSMTYDISLRLLKFIPIKIKDVIFEFVKKEEVVLLRQLDLERKAPEYLGEKVNQLRLTDKWCQRIGKYQLTNPIATYDEDFNFALASFELKEVMGWPVLVIKTPGQKLLYCLTIQSDNLAVTGGMGRHAGDRAIFLEDGTMLFSGFELKPIR